MKDILYRWLTGYMDRMGFVLYGGGKGGSAPPPPDYAGAAAQQAASSREVTDVQNWANRPNLETPWGKTEWNATADVDPATGKPINKWTGKVTLSPDEQAAKDAQARIQAGRSQGAETLLGQSVGSLQDEFNWEGMPKAPGDINEAQQSAYDKMIAMYQPGMQEEQAGLETRLANMGVGSESNAYARNKRLLAEQQGRQKQQLAAEAMTQGRADAGTQSQLRQQAIAEEAQRRGMPLNELNALLTGQQVSMPQMPGFANASRAEPLQALNAAQMQGNYNLNAAQMNQKSGPDWGSMIGSGVGAAAMMWSDRRLKHTLVHLGAGWYEFSYVGSKERHVGVMAQDLQRFRPDLVHVHPSGFLMVDYSGV